MSSNVDVQSREVTAAVAVLGALSFCHLLNDMMQSLLPAMYPILKSGLKLDFGQIGLVTFVYQVTASLFQPLVGLLLDLQWDGELLNGVRVYKPEAFLKA